MEQGRYPEAERLIRVALEITSAVGVAPDSVSNALLLSRLGNVLNWQRKTREAQIAFDELDRALATWETGRREKFLTYGSRIVSLYRSGQINLGLATAEKFLGQELKRVGPKHVDAAFAQGTLADADTRAKFLLSSAASGGVAMTKLALERFGDLRAQPVPFPLVVAAARTRMNTTGSYYREQYAKPEYAIWVRNFDPPAVMRLLIAAGADPRAIDRDGNTALHVTDNADVAQILVDAGANPNAANAKGRTPLHEAATAPLVRVLIRAGAHVDAEDDAGETPLFECYDAQSV